MLWLDEIKQRNSDAVNIAVLHGAAKRAHRALTSAWADDSPNVWAYVQHALATLEHAIEEVEAQ